MLDLIHDLGSCCRPNEGAGITVILANVFRYRAVEIVDAVKGSAPDALAGDLGKPSLHQVQPRSAGGSKVQVVTRMRGEPRLHFRVGMRTVVVEDQMDVPPARRGSLDPLQKR